jgi:hypothetical protein
MARIRGEKERASGGGYYEKWRLFCYNFSGNI